MAAPTTTGSIEALLQAPGKTAEGNQWMAPLGLPPQRIKRHPGNRQQRHTHQDSPHWFSNTMSLKGRAVAHPSRTSIGAE
ncbi:hypothetical protein D3C75_1115230 [compost metagenome]